jgi:hypothetical protein
MQQSNKRPFSIRWGIKIDVELSWAVREKADGFDAIIRRWGYLA